MTALPPDPRTIRIRELLERAIAASGLPKSRIEHSMGVSRGYLTQLLQGKIDLKFTTVHRILDLIEISPPAFFQLAYGRPPVQPAGPAEQFLRELEIFRQGRTLPPALATESLRSLVQGFVQEALVEFKASGLLPPSGSLSEVED